MEELIRQVEKAISDKQYYLALMVCLSLPDICGALQSKNGQAQRNRYIRWFDHYLGPHYDGFMKGDTCYFYRCSVLHQGRAKHKYLGYSRIMFLEPGTGMVMHRCIMNDALQLDISIFATDIINGVRAWLKDMDGNEQFEEHYEHFIKRHEKGVPPYIVGLPVIA